MMKWIDPKSVVWDLGFRPFFLAAATQALLTMILWIGTLTGSVPIVRYFPITIWHGHEMIFGFTGAVIVGFVLTATQNWTGIRGVHGRRLQGLLLLWILGRLGILFAPGPHPLVAAIDLAFFPIAGAYLIPYLKDIEMRTERVFYLYYLIFLGSNLTIHLESFGFIQGYSSAALRLALHTIIAMIVFMGGRVIPFFTESNIARAQPKTWPWLEVSSHIGLWLFILTQMLLPDSWPALVVALGAALIHLGRLYGWQVRRVRRIPLIWVLHLGYLWICVGILLTGLASARSTLAPLLSVAFPVTAATHCFTVGGLGLIVYGMISRVSLGHTGRRLHPARATVVAYHLLNAATAMRVFGPWLLPQATVPFLHSSATLWTIAFGIFLWVYGKILVQPRFEKLVQIQPSPTA